MIPSISYSYRPDFGDPRHDYFQEVQTDSDGNTRTFSRHSGFVYGQSSRGESSAINFSLSNTLEMKYRNKKDTTGKAEKVVLLRNFGLNTSYNMAADSFKLSNISISAATNLLSNKDLGKGATTTGLNLNFRGTIDPYLYVLDSINFKENGDQQVYQRRLNQFAFNNGKGLGQFTSFNVSLSTGFKAKKNSSSRSRSSNDNRSFGTDQIPGNEMAFNSVRDEQEYEDYLANPDLYVDFNIPWSINFRYNISYSQVGFREGKVTQSLQFNGDLSLTEKWKATFSSGYDFEKDQFNQTRVGITRDLHCWDMRLDWVPFGRFQSYNFTIKAKSSMLQDLKLSRKRNPTESFSFQ
jgi:hypothetical protein